MNAERDTGVRVDAEEVMALVAFAYEFHLGRHPGFAEVEEHFRRFKGGQTLADVVRAIAFSPEASGRGNRAPQEERAEHPALERLVRLLYRRFLERDVSEAELAAWAGSWKAGASIPDIVFAIEESPEAVAARTARSRPLEVPGTFVQDLFETMEGRAATPAEIAHYRDLLEAGTTDSQSLLQAFFARARLTMPERGGTGPSAGATGGPDAVRLFGADQPQISRAEWTAKAHALGIRAPGQQALAPEPWRVGTAPQDPPTVSIIASIYKGRRHIEGFMRNITAQSAFPRCELIVVDAASPDGEGEVVSRYQKDHRNIRYHRTERHIGLYQAWNTAIRLASGRYCTNANVDDCRRGDSIELQMGLLDSMPFVDVVYQDVCYSFEDHLDFEQIAAVGARTDLPITSRYNLTEFNLPHNAPMWRRKLHDEIGFFDEGLESAGDFEFWLRCHMRGSTFYKTNDAHVAYFVNPRGLSTKADSRAAAEMKDISRRHYRKLVSANVTCPRSEFLARLGGGVAGAVQAGNRYDDVQEALRALSAASRGKAVPEMVGAP